MSVKALEIHGAKLIQLTPYRDFRGVFEIGWDSAALTESGISFTPTGAYHSYNEKAATLRGMHYQPDPHGQAKLVSCIRGAVFDVIVDVRRDSPTFLCWLSCELEEESGRLLYIPPGCAHGFVTLKDHSTVEYFIEGDYRPDLAATIRWNDPTVGIRWPVQDPILSERDRNALDFSV